ncbi:patatin-like phospholipase family protein [Planctobacterium marinum]|uniref:Patatin n=1 Tax=Planctobacterium marinum TaxID=1631968 RepID=A0AA48HXA1_9ALTE|nr:patatin [Planctobacterium marinum]
MTDRDEFALILSGGGARAAYQIGVLKSLTQYLPRNHKLPFPVLCGTSAGAINATALACYASCFHLGVRKLEWVWKNFKTEQVYDASLSEVAGYITRNYLSSWRSENISRSPGSLLNNQPLRILIKRMMDFARIDRNIMSGNLNAINISASCYSERNAVSFFQGKDQLQGWKRHHRQGIPCTLEIDHLLASSAIPIVFPPVRIGDDYYGDGAIHESAPLSAPIHLGARKIFVIGVVKDKPDTPHPHMHTRLNSAQIAGHLLDTIFSDALESDIERMNRVNQTLNLLTPQQQKLTDLKPVECFIINPSKSIQNLAWKYYDELPGGIKALLRLIGVNRSSESSLLSYLMFEGKFCSELIQLGYQDGLAQQDAIRKFLEL